MYFLGHVVVNKGVEVDHIKTEGVKNFPKPLIPTNIRSFLGLAGYYRRFMKGFYFVASPLTTLTKKKVMFEWADTCEKKFQDLKNRLNSAPVLTLPTCAENYTIYCYAYRVGLGCVLMQGRKVIDYSSRQLKVYEKIIPLMTWSLQLWCLQ